MDWKNWLIAAAGVAAAPYTGGATLALTSAAIQAAGSKSAAKQLQKASDQALTAQQSQNQIAQGRIDQAQNIQGGLYQNAQRALNPYTSLGGGAASTLGQLIGIPVTSPGQMTMPTGGSLTKPPYQGPSNAQGQFLTSVDPGNPDGTVMNRGVPPLSNSPVGQAVPRGTLASLIPQAEASRQSQSSYVTMQAPTGETSQVPANQVQHFTRLGARLVG
jgi:hypothetical protein